MALVISANNFPAVTTESGLSFHKISPSETDASALQTTEELAAALSTLYDGLTASELELNGLDSRNAAIYAQMSSARERVLALGASALNSRPIYPTIIASGGAETPLQPLGYAGLVRFSDSEPTGRRRRRLVAQILGRDDSDDSGQRLFTGWLSHKGCEQQGLETSEVAAIALNTVARVALRAGLRELVIVRPAEPASTASISVIEHIAPLADFNFVPDLQLSNSEGARVEGNWYSGQLHRYQLS